MVDTGMNLKRLENDKKLCDKVTEILLVLTNAEKQGQNLYRPFQQIERTLNDLQDAYLLNLYQKLLRGFQTATTHEQIWADNYFTFILQLCDLLNDTRTKVNQDDQTEDITISLIPA